MAQTPKDKEDEILDSLDDFDIDTSNFTLDELPPKDSDTADDSSLPEIDDDFNLIPEDNDTDLDELYINDDDSFSDLSDLDLAEESENEGEEIFLTPESVSPADSDENTDSNESDDFLLDLDDEELSADDDSSLTDDNDDSALSLENLLDDDLLLSDDADDISDELNLDEDIDLSGLLDDDDDEEFCGVALKEGPQTIIIPQKQLSEDLIDSLIDEDENSDIINFSFPEKNETVSQEDEDYLKLDLTEDQELLANEINADNHLDELSHHINDDNLLSDDELDKLVSESSDKENEETETTIEDEEIIISNENNDTPKNISDTLDNNEKDYEDDFNDLELVSLDDNETLSLDNNESAEPVDDDFIIEEGNELDLNTDDDEETISLSDNELDNILDSTELTDDTTAVDDADPAIDNIEPIDDNKETDTLIEDNDEPILNLDDDEESISLSDNELDNILDSTELTDDTTAIDDADPAIDNIEPIGNNEEIDTLIEDNDEPILNLDDDEESISLSDNELDNILDSTELTDDTTAVDYADSTIDNIEPIDNNEEIDTLIEDNDEPILELDDEEDSIGLSTNELDNILDNTELIETEMLESIPEDEIEAKIEEVLNDDTSLNLDNEPVGLSLNELDNILDTTELIETENDDFPAEIAEEINNSDLQPLTSSKEDDAAIYSSLKAEMQAKEAKEAEAKTELLKKDVKTVLSYLDQLLDALPEEKIKEFAESKEFDIYKKLFEELNIKIN